MLIVPVTRSLIYQAIAKQMAVLASPEDPIAEFTTVFLDRDHLDQYDGDIHRLIAPIVEKRGGHLSVASVEEVGMCGVLAFGFANADEAIVFARECESALSEIEFSTVVSVWDTKHWINHEPVAPKRKKEILASRGEGV